ncbi:MAG: hypothetical protein ACJAWL_003633 [Motiliproteus sp.]|jgi:hypothetical protein
MIRHYFLTGSLGLTKEVTDILHHQLKVNKRHLHVVSRDELGLKQHQLRVANIFQQRDLVRGAELGAIIGFVFSLILFSCAVMAMVFWTADPTLKQAIFLGSIGLPLLLGTALGALIGATRENHKIGHFRHDLDNGFHLLVVDADRAISVAIRNALTTYVVISAGKDSPIVCPFPNQNTHYELARAA